MSYNTRKTTLSRYGGWLPVNPLIHRSFVRHHSKLAIRHSESKAGHIPSVETFGNAIKNSPEMNELFNQIFLQVSPENQVKDFDTLLHMLDGILVAPPAFHIAKDEQGNVIGEPIGVPVYLLFDLLSNTGAAYDLFRRDDFNAALKAMLDDWGKYLTTLDSNKTLNSTDEGWFGQMGLLSLENLRGDFNTTWVVPDPNADNRGYTSWDHFFTREYQPQARPIDAPDNNTLLRSACESTVYRIVEGVKRHDQFWLKGQPYSLYDMLNRHDDLVDQFVNGTVYQAFLSPQDYHRWRSPVAGKVVKAELVPGTYYAVIPDAGAEVGDPDLKPGDPHGALIRSQAWLTMNAARALIFIQADNPDVGLMCFIGVGMAEVSTCEITVKEGQQLAIGDELGMFHFGGSSHALIFGPQTKVTFADNVKVDQHLWVNSIIGQFSKAAPNQ